MAYYGLIIPQEKFCHYHTSAKVTLSEKPLQNNAVLLIYNFLGIYLNSHWMLAGIGSVR